MQTVITSVIDEKKAYWKGEEVEYTTKLDFDLVLWSIRLNGIQCLTSGIINQIDSIEASGKKFESKILGPMSAAQAKAAAEEQKQAAYEEREKVLMILIERNPELGPYDPSLNQC